ncbi:MAG: ribonuclease HII [Leptospirales bacterium]
MPKESIGPDATLERLLHSEGYSCIVGVDEVGRGALAGPVMAAAVVLPFPHTQFESLGVKDSKLLSPRKRDDLFSRFLEEPKFWEVGVSSVEEIHQLGIRLATLQAMRRAIQSLSVTPDLILVDGQDIVPGLEVPQRPIPSGDRTVLSIAVSSIIAKVHRDREMVQLDQTFHGYDFFHNKGYGTKAHREGLLKLGLSSSHRIKFCRTFLSSNQGNIF